MTIITQEIEQQQRTIAIVKAYPLVVLLISLILNVFVFKVNSIAVALPSSECIHALVVSAVLLVVNHTWLMTTTELTRVRFSMYATPEQWVANGTSLQDMPELGSRELERRHNTHRNTTENVVYFIFLALILVLISPTTIAAQVWIFGFPLARLGYTYSYLTGKDDIRGIFMSLSLLATYGMASYLVMGLMA